jgi:hypothetical protein
VSPALEAVVMRCFLRPPEQRIQNVADLAGDLLDAVQAPFAMVARARIAATLGARTSKDALSTTGSLGGSGSYGAMLSGSSGTGRAVVPVTSSQPPAPEATASPTSISAGAMSARPRVGLWITIAGVAALVGGGIFALAGRGDDKAPAAATTAASGPVAPPVATTAAATTTGAATASAPSETATASTAASATATPPAAINRGVWRPPIRQRPGAATAAPPPTTAALPPAATPPPAATAAPTPTKQTDPLGDRQ